VPERIVIAVEAQIRVATEADAGGILHCLSEAFAPYETRYTAAGFRDTILDRDSLRKRMEGMHVLVACFQDEIVGTIAGAVEQKGQGHLRGMAVLPRFHGSGIATKLLRAIEDWLRDQGCSRITLDTTEPLLPAMKFYENHGYARSGRVSDFFAMPLLEYVKELN
jgi:GNAT superfamily N-acetyltransferase